MKIVREKMNEWKFKEEESIRGIQQPNKNASDDFKYAVNKNWLKIKRQIGPNEFLMFTNWGSDIIVKIEGYYNEDS